LSTQTPSGGSLFAHLETSLVNKEESLSDGELAGFFDDLADAGMRGLGRTGRYRERLQRGRDDDA